MSVENIRGNIKQTGNSITVRSGLSTQAAIVSSDVNSSAITLTLPRLSASGAIMGIINGGTGSKNVVFDTTGSSSHTLTLASVITGNQTLTFPNATDTLVGKATTDILLNKEISGATNTLTAIPGSALASDASIAFSKLAALTSGNILVGNASNVAASIAMTGDVTINNSGVTAIGSEVIVNADISASAAIADTKLGTISTSGKVANSATTAASANTSSAIVARDGSGNFSAGTISATFDGPVEASLLKTDSANVTITGDLLFAKPSSVHAKITSAVDNFLNYITGASDGDTLIVTNTLGTSITVQHDLGSGGFLTGTGGAIQLADDASMAIRYDGTANRWFILGGVGNLTSVDITTTSANVTVSGNQIALPSATHLNVTGGDADVAFITGGAVGQTILLTNNTGGDMEIVNDINDEGFITGTGDNLDLADNASLLLRYHSDLRWYVIGGSGAGGSAETKVNQVGHGLSVGELIYFDGTDYLMADASAANTAEVVGIVSKVDGTALFRFTTSGVVLGLSGLTAGDVYFLGTAGALTATEPTTIGHVSLPVGVALSTTSLALDIKRGIVVGGTNARTQLSLTNNATTNIQDMAAYDAGEITGWVSIDGTTDLRFHTRIMFAKNGAGTNYNLNYETVGDTPPVGFNIDITSVGVIQLTLPSITGFVSAFINYALNAPAVGTTFPLTVEASAVRGRVDGAAPTAGFIGEVVEDSTPSSVTPAASNSWKTVKSITLTPGVWMLSGAVELFANPTAPTSLSSLRHGFHTTADAQPVPMFTYKLSNPVVLSGASTNTVTVPQIVNISATTTFYLNARLVYSALGSTVYTGDSICQAVRIA